MDKSFRKPRRASLVRVIREGVRRRPAAIARFRELVPDFGRRPLSMKDFVEECERRDITFVLVAMEELWGLTWTVNGAANIALNSNLAAEALEFAAFHELSHQLVHSCEQRHLLKLNESAALADTLELEADAIAAIAVHPELMAEALQPRSGQRATSPRIPVPDTTWLLSPANFLSGGVR